MAQSWGRISGASVERYSGDDDRFIVVSYHRTELGRNGIGLDFGLGLVPVALRYNTALIDVDAGLAVARRVGPATVLLKGGPSSFVSLFAENEFYPGVQAGVTLVVPLERRCGLRLDLARHFYFPGDRNFQLWSLGVGLALLPATRGAVGRTDD